jgi:hypothetical protein
MTTYQVRPLNGYNWCHFFFAKFKTSNDRTSNFKTLNLGVLSLEVLNLAKKKCSLTIDRFKTKLQNILIENNYYLQKFDFYTL